MSDGLMTCPGCSAPLVRAQEEQGIFWACDACGGRAATLPLLRKIVEEDALKELWKLARLGSGTPKRPCPSCQNLMMEVPSKTVTVEPTEERPDGEETVIRPALDICVRCHIVWFDIGEELPVAQQQPDTEEDLPPEAREALAMAQVELLEEQRQRNVAADRVSETLRHFFFPTWRFRF